MRRCWYLLSSWSDFDSCVLNAVIPVQPMAMAMAWSVGGCLDLVHNMSTRAATTTATTTRLLLLIGGVGSDEPNSSVNAVTVWLKLESPKREH